MNEKTLETKELKNPCLYCGNHEADTKCTSCLDKYCKECIDENGLCPFCGGSDQI